MRKPDEKEKFVMICTLCVWLSFAFFHSVHIPAQKEIQQMEHEAADLSLKIIDIENFANKHQNIKEYAADISKRQEKVDKALPNALEQSSVINLLQRHALNRQLQLVSITPGQTKTEHGLTMLPLQIKMNCDYFQLLDFLKAIQEDARFLQITRLGAHSADDRLSFEIEANVYSMAEQQTS